ncbi:hypothetical protein CAL12_26505 [Bordetella genomosp. 8]|uniref:Four-carbon acid sugar kinase family protein n=1 Tax=Bordetella genomosp. 8 TaxID=1416806 RepID=A0A1W6YSE1_9BORD|nr:four-carbon acid sugar kinase family protein [Bordetella genomosp. 8]ARP84015.1 hypothetical protein CAL12_26505 [Bordetella genomosp. 8]
MADPRDGRPRLAYYGDDFTGSTDTLATVVSAGLRAVLFLDVPTADELAHFGSLDCVGVAGTARAMSPAEMDVALPRIFRGLAATGADVLHYKCCSTFDSAPHIGSIGHAVRLAWRELEIRPAYIVGGQPNLGRYCSFGHLYARAGQDGPVYRLDRHPTMSRHPVTPMDESDLRAHLARQGLEGIASFDLAMLDDAPDAAAARLDALLGEGAAGVLFDATRTADLARVGALLRHRLAVERKPLLAVGPTGVLQALLATDVDRATPASAAGHATPVYAADHVHRTHGQEVSQTFIVAGSRSPITAAQIAAAEQAGFVSIALDAAAMVANDAEYRASLDGRIVQALRAGRSVVAHSTLGDDSGARRPGFTRALALACGGLMADVLAAYPLARAGFAGGDTSSLAVQSWGARALTFSYSPSPGVAVCRVHAPGHPADGVELMLKGGQMGAPSLFSDLLAGGSAPSPPA